jgi:hypothetical protein
VKRQCGGIGFPLQKSNKTLKGLGRGGGGGVIGHYWELEVPYRYIRSRGPFRRNFGADTAANGRPYLRDSAPIPPQEGSIPPQALWGTRGSHSAAANAQRWRGYRPGVPNRRRGVPFRRRAGWESHSAAALDEGRGTIPPQAPERIRAGLVEKALAWPVNRARLKRWRNRRGNGGSK